MNHSSTQVIQECHLAGRLGRFEISQHAEERMLQRGAAFRDVKAALISCSSARWQTDQESWKMEGGVDTDGDPLTIAVVLENGVLVVTLF